MNFYIGMAIGIIIGFFIGAHLSDYYAEGFQTTATGDEADSTENVLPVPVACKTINYLSESFLNRMKNRPEYTSTDPTIKGGVELLINGHIEMIEKQKQDLGCP